MNKAYLTVAAAIVAGLLAGDALAQCPGAEGRHGGEGKRGGPGGREAFLVKMITHKDVAEKVGLTDEQVTTLKDSVYETRKKLIDLKAELEKAGMEQAKLLSGDTIDEAAVMAAIDKTAGIRTEMAKLHVKSLIMVKQTLTPEQIDQAKEHMRGALKKKGSRGGRCAGCRGKGKKRGHRKERGDKAEDPAEEALAEPE